MMYGEFISLYFDVSSFLRVVQLLFSIFSKNAFRHLLKSFEFKCFKYLNSSLKANYKSSGNTSAK